MFLSTSLYFVRFGQLLRCAHKYVINMMKVYIERNNIQVELIRLRKKYRLYSSLLLRIEVFPTDAMFTQPDRQICVIDRSRCTTDGMRNRL